MVSSRRLVEAYAEARGLSVPELLEVKRCSYKWLASSLALAARQHEAARWEAERVARVRRELGGGSPEEIVAFLARRREQRERRLAELARVY